MLIHTNSQSYIKKKYIVEEVLIVSDAFMHFTAVAYSINQSDLKYIYKRLLLDGIYDHVKIILSTTTVGGHRFSQLCHQNVRTPN